MNWEIRLLATLLPILYGISAVAYALTFIRNDTFARVLAPRVLGIAVITHVLYLIAMIAELRHVPIASSFEALSVLALALAIVYLFIEKRSGTPYTGIVFVPLIFVGQTLASAFINPSVVVNPLLQNPLFGLHIGAALLGYSGFAVAAVYGLLYLMLYNELRGHRFGLVYQRLPSLEILSGMNLRGAVFGFVCLTLAIGAGALMSVELFPEFWQDPKVWLSVGIWLVYAVCLSVRYLAGWREKHIAYFTIAGFMLLLFSMLAANRLFSSFHDFST